MPNINLDIEETKYLNDFISLNRSHLINDVCRNNIDDPAVVDYCNYLRTIVNTLDILQVRLKTMLSSIHAIEMLMTYIPGTETAQEAVEYKIDSDDTCVINAERLIINHEYLFPCGSGNDYALSDYEIEAAKHIIAAERNKRE